MRAKEGMDRLYLTGVVTYITLILGVVQFTGLIPPWVLYFFIITERKRGDSKSLRSGRGCHPIMIAKTTA